MRSVAAGSARTRKPAALTVLLVVALVALPIFEVWLLIQVGQAVGVLPTVAILVGEAVVGAWLMRREGSRAYTALLEALRTGRMPTAELADAALVLVGGVLLMLPGFATDVIGFCCLLPFTRPWARRLLGYLAGRRLERLGLPTFPQPLQPSSYVNGDVISGETVDAPPPQGWRRSTSPEIISGKVDDTRR